MLHKFISEAVRIREATRRYRKSPLWFLRRYLRLYRRRHFSRDEIHFLKLLDPGQDLSSFVSKEELVRLQRQLNPPAFHALTEDKLQFQRRCREAGLPAPPIYALYSRRADEPAEFPRIEDEAGLLRFLASPPSSELVLKPIDGVHGDGVVRLTRRAGEWFDNRGAPMSANRIVEHVARWPYERWMLQQRVFGHADLCELSGSDGLQTLRVVTMTGNDGNVEMLAARLRLIASDTVHDNFDYGKTGNLIANLDITSGRIRSVITGGGDPREIRHVVSHPRTGSELIGYGVPHWREVGDLVLRAGRAFAPLRTIGWDVAVTPDGACLIEGNVTWDTLSGEPRMGEIYRRLQSLLA